MTRRTLLLASLLVGACAQGNPDPVGPDADAGSPLDSGPSPTDAQTPDDGDMPIDAADCADTPETCNGRDDDCDGTVDEDPTDGTLYYRDLDGDTWGSDTDTVMACALPDDSAVRGGDCQDGSDLIHPGSSDTCDGLDNDCAGGIDDAGCPVGCTGVPFGGHGYAFCEVDLSWAAARAACVAAGLQLVRVDNTMENDFLYTTASAAGGIGDFFIGAQVTVGGTNQWQWADGEAFWDGILGGSAIGGLFAAWEADQPDDNGPPSCALSRDRMMGLWHDASCDTPNDYVCERY